MTTHSSVLAWRIPGMGSLAGCCLWGRTESDTTEATLQQQQHLLHLHMCACALMCVCVCAHWCVCVCVCPCFILKHGILLEPQVCTLFIFLPIRKNMFPFQHKALN